MYFIKWDMNWDAFTCFFYLLVFAWISQFICFLFKFLMYSVHPSIHPSIRFCAACLGCKSNSLSRGVQTSLSLVRRWYQCGPQPTDSCNLSPGSWVYTELSFFTYKIQVFQVRLLKCLNLLLTLSLHSWALTLYLFPFHFPFIYLCKHFCLSFYVPLCISNHCNLQAHLHNLAEMKNKKRKME